MTLRLMRWLEGSRDYRVAAECSSLAVRLLMRSGAEYRRLRSGKDGLTFTLSGRDCGAMERIFKNSCVEFVVTKERGIKYLAKRYRKRIGIPIGIILFFAVLLLSEKFVWTVHVSGNHTVPTVEIIERLDGLGFGVGSYIPGVDVLRLRDEYLLAEPRISWMSVNIRGTAVTVEVRETEIPEITVPKGTPFNLVAKEDGFVEYVEILRGSPMVREGALVRKGELLASGIEELKNGLHLVHASGTVLAAVRRDITVEVPLESVQKELTGREYSKKTLNIFGIAVEFFNNTENISSECDKIERERMLRFFDAIEVPVVLKETVFREYTDVPVTLTEDEARTEAYSRLGKECEKALSDCELISRETREGISDGVFIIECRLTVLANIADEVPIYTSDVSK